MMLPPPQYRRKFRKRRFQMIDDSFAKTFPPAKATLSVTTMFHNRFKTLHIRLVRACRRIAFRSRYVHPPCARGSSGFCVFDNLHKHNERDAVP
jgi:hypothetical protein